jgi:hypothetical protein
MKKTNKSWKTTLVGIIGVIFLMLSMTLVFLGKATLTEVTKYAGGIGTCLTILNSFLAKDSTATHTCDKNDK